MIATSEMLYLQRIIPVYNQWTDYDGMVKVKSKWWRWSHHHHCGVLMISQPINKQYLMSLTNNRFSTDM